MCFIQNVSNETITNNTFVSNHTFLYLYLYVTWQYALLCYRATDAIEPHCGFLGSRQMETAPTSIEVFYVQL